MEFAGLPWDFERQKWGLGRPQTGSAVHHLVTALRLKKALTARRGFCALFNVRGGNVRAGHPNRSDAPRTQSGKMRNRRPAAHCAGDIVKE
jgi:hypothetical protein